MFVRGDELPWHPLFQVDAERLDQFVGGGAFGLPLQRAIDRPNLTPDAANAIEQFIFLFDCVGRSLQ
jgi:hypothetical protein